MIFTLVIIAGVITGIFDIYRLGVFGDANITCTLLLLHQFVVLFGCVGVVGFFSNIVFAKQNAEHLGWPGGPWQIKYGVAQIAIGVLGILSIWFRGGFWLATLINWYMYSVSGIWSHLNSMKMNAEAGKTDRSDFAMIIVTIVYAIYLTVLSLNIQGFWNIGY